MPSPDYVYKAAVLIACSGDRSTAANRGIGPKGEFVSKAQSRLSYAIADVKAWYAHFEGERLLDLYEEHAPEPVPLKDAGHFRPAFLGDYVGREEAPYGREFGWVTSSAARAAAEPNRSARGGATRVERVARRWSQAAAYRPVVVDLQRRELNDQKPTQSGLSRRA